MVLEESSSSRDFWATGDGASPDGHDSSTAGTLRRISNANSIRTMTTEASTTVTQDELQLSYRLNEGPLRRYHLRFDRMPLQGLSLVAAFGEPPRPSPTSRSLVDLMSTMDELNGRPLTQTEAEGLALHVSRRKLYGVASFYSSIALGGLIAYSRRKTFKFPLRKPKPVEQYNSFPLQRMPLLSAKYARAAWHLTRGFAYVGASLVLISPLCNSLARTSQDVHLMRDERTRAVAQETGVSLQKVLQQARDQKNKNRRSTKRQRAGQGADQSGSDSSPDEDHYGGFQGGRFQDDDNSPTSSQYPYSDTSNTGVMSDTQVQPRTSSQRSTPSADPVNRNTFDIDRVERQPRNFESEYGNPNDSTSSSSTFFDDASPTARNDPYSPSASNTSSYPSSSSSGSAWARIRKTANSDASAPQSYPTPPSTDPTNKQGILPSHMRQTRSQSPSARQLQQNSARDEYETSGDSFSFSKEGADRQLAKEQAQKEFDQMVEAERRGHGSGTQAGGGGGESGEGQSAWGRRRGL